MSQKVKLIAEFCCNHMGDIEVAKLMIDSLASFPKEFRPDIIKFQKRTPRLILSEKEFNSPHPNPENSFGDTYGTHREFLEFDVAQHKILKKYCEEKGFIYSTSVFDRNSVDEILSLSPKMIKISSANNTDYELLKYIDKKFNGEIHISLGMTTKKEEEIIFSSIVKNRKNLVFYACTSAYPVKSGDVCLLEIPRLKEKYGKSVKAVGFSGHHEGILYDTAAVALGAEYVERHFTLDKKLKGTDQVISLMPDEFLELSKNIKLISKDLTLKSPEILKCEESCRKRYNK